MKNSGNNAFAGLPVDFVKEILAKSGQIADEIYAPFHEIRNNREKLRDQLQEHTGIQHDSGGQSSEILTSCAVSGYSVVDDVITSALACSAAFAVEGLIPPSKENHWVSPAHKALFHTDQQHPDTVAILHAIAMEMEVELAAGAPHSIILRNGSFITPFLSVMETLRVALGSKDSITSQEFIARLKQSIVSFKTIFGSQNTKKMWVGIPGNNAKSELAKRLNWSEKFSEKVLFTILLSPGEFTSPGTLEQPGLSRVKNLPIKDEKFAALRDSIVATISTMQVIYYRPYEWTPVLRIEIDSSVAQDTSRLIQMLAGVKFQCSTAGVLEPYPIYRAKKLVNGLEKAIPSLRKSATSRITNIHRDDIGEIFPLLMFR